MQWQNNGVTTREERDERLFRRKTSGDGQETFKHKTDKDRLVYVLPRKPSVKTYSRYWLPMPYLRRAHEWQSPWNNKAYLSWWVRSVTIREERGEPLIFILRYRWDRFGSRMGWL